MNDIEHATCPRCKKRVGPDVPRRGAGVMEHLCEGCSTVLRVRYFWGDVIEAEEFFTAGEGERRE